MSRKLAIFLTISLFILLLAFPRPVISDEISDLQQKCKNDLKACQDEIQRLEGLIAERQQTSKNLASQIAYMNNQINLTTLKIAETEKKIDLLENEIASLSGKIAKLEIDLTNLSKLLLNRIIETYKQGRINPLVAIFSTHSFSEFLRQTKYIQAAQIHDKKIMIQVQETKDNFTEQKKLREEKKKEQETLMAVLARQKKELAQQKQSKQALLTITQNDERKYQELLAVARAEMEAIQSILAGRGEETEVGHVGEGEAIASVISSKSYCSTGTHLHFEVAVGGVHNNPANYLKPIDVDWDLCGWWGCDGNFSFTGSWNWPINGKPRITQGYGMTAYARAGAYNGNPHTGIDMVSDDLTVKSVKSGTLYRGGISCGGGILRYMKVVHDDDKNTETYYLHINYTK